MRTFSLALIVSLAPLAYGQGAEAKAAYDKLVPLSGAPRVAAVVASESAKLDAVEDAAWLSGALADAAKDAREKKSLLSEQASLFELLGRYGDAAAAWEKAAGVVPGIADAACLLSAAACRLSSGEGEAAARLATAASYSSPDPVTARLAALVLGWAALANGERDEALSAARASVSDPDARVAISALVLARASSEGAERAEFQRRLGAMSSRPEAASVTPLFLVAGTTAVGGLVEAAPVKPPSAPVSDAPTPAQTFYQVGAFKDEANAEALRKKIAALGMKPVVKKKSGKDIFIVYVGGGADDAKTVLTLKDAGYEAWALESEP